MENTVKNNTEKKMSVALSSVFASAGLTLMKLIVGILSGSMGIISEAAHSALDLGAALLTYFAVKISSKPADATHHYGHGKVESVSALIETGLLFITSAWIIYESVHRLINNKTEVETTWYTFAVVIVSIVIDISRSRALKRVAKETHSQALEADALHFSSDIWSSAVVLAGLALAAFGIQSADTYAAIGVSLFVAYAGYNLGKRTIDSLMDVAPEGLREEVLQVTKDTKGVLGVEKVRIRTIGPDVFIDMTVFVSRKLPLMKAHSIIDVVSANIRRKLPGSDISVNAQPLPLDSETLVERVRIVADQQELRVHDIVVHLQNQRKYLSYDLEVPEHFTLEKAHALATKFEREIQEEIGTDIEINTHIEPLRPEIIAGESLATKEEEAITKEVLALVDGVKKVENVHTMKIRKAGHKIFISFHCSFNKNLVLEEAHNIASDLESLIKKTLPNIERVLVHTEPSNGGKDICHE